MSEGITRLVAELCRIEDDLGEKGKSGVLQSMLQHARQFLREPEAIASPSTSRRSTHPGSTRSRSGSRFWSGSLSGVAISHRRNIFSSPDREFHRLLQCHHGEWTLPLDHEGETARGLKQIQGRSNFRRGVLVGPVNSCGPDVSTKLVSVRNPPKSLAVKKIASANESVPFAVVSVPFRTPMSDRLAVKAAGAGLLGCSQLAVLGPLTHWNNKRSACAELVSASPTATAASAALRNVANIVTPRLVVLRARTVQRTFVTSTLSANLRLRKRPERGEAGHVLPSAAANVTAQAPAKQPDRSAHASCSCSHAGRTPVHHDAGPSGPASGRPPGRCASSAARRRPQRLQDGEHDRSRPALLIDAVGGTWAAAGRMGHYRFYEAQLLPTTSRPWLFPSRCGSDAEASARGSALSGMGRRGRGLDEQQLRRPPERRCPTALPSCWKIGWG